MVKSRAGNSRKNVSSSYAVRVRWSLRRAHYHGVGTVTLRDPSLRHHRIARRAIRRVTVIGISAIREHAVHRHLACATVAEIRRIQEEELRGLEHEHRVLDHRAIALVLVATEE